MCRMDTAELAASLQLLLSGGQGISSFVLDQAIDQALKVTKVCTSCDSAANNWTSDC